MKSILEKGSNGIAERVFLRKHFNRRAVNLVVLGFIPSSSLSSPSGPSHTGCDVVHCNLYRKLGNPGVRSLGTGCCLTLYVCLSPYTVHDSLSCCLFGHHASFLDEWDLIYIVEVFFLNKSCMILGHI